MSPRAGAGFVAGEQFCGLFCHSQANLFLFSEISARPWLRLIPKHVRGEAYQSEKRDCWLFPFVIRFVDLFLSPKPLTINSETG